jgi:DNA-binding response OmpR family regulator
VAASGEEALCLLDTRAYEVVICDVNLRGIQPDAISGLELYSRLSNGLGVSQHSQRPLFLFMTGELVEKENVENLPAGVRTLQKPFRISDLVTVLNESLMSTTSGGAAGPALNS